MLLSFKTLIFLFLFVVHFFISSQQVLFFCVNLKCIQITYLI